MSAYDAIEKAIIAVLMGRDLSHDAQLGPLMAALTAAKGAPAPAAAAAAAAAPVAPKSITVRRSNYLEVPEDLLPFIKNRSFFNKLTLEEKEPIINAIGLVMKRGDIPFPNIGNASAGGMAFPRDETGKSRAMQLITKHTTLQVYSKDGVPTNKWIRLPSAVSENKSRRLRAAAEDVGDSSDETASVAGDEEEE